MWGKSQDRVSSTIHEAQRRLPFPLLGLDSDNGSEFINQNLLTYCQRNKITFTRGRSNKKNDGCYVEQKNWTVVRQLVGYDRYNSRPALDCLNRIYHLQRLYVNFFHPLRKLVSKTRDGAKVHMTGRIHPIRDCWMPAYSPSPGSKNLPQPTAVSIPSGSKRKYRATSINW